MNLHFASLRQFLNYQLKKRKRWQKASNVWLTNIHELASLIAELHISSQCQMSVLKQLKVKIMDTDFNDMSFPILKIVATQSSYPQFSPLFDLVLNGCVMVSGIMALNEKTESRVWIAFEFFTVTYLQIPLGKVRIRLFSPPPQLWIARQTRS